MKNIPQGRALIYIMILCLLPSFAIGFYLWTSYGALENLDQKMDMVRDQAFVKEKRQAVNQSLRSHFKEPDQFYIDKQLETLTFLDQETEALQKIFQQKNMPEDETTRKRLEFLTGPGNSISFTEGVVQNYGSFQETTETLSHPIEVNSKDISKILSRIEGVSFNGEELPTGRPQLIVLDFKLEKKKATDKNEVFQLNMKLLKREFL